MRPSDLERLRAKSGNKPGKHHFIPAFLLARWTVPTAGGARLLVEYKRVHGGKLSPQRRAPDGTGYVRDLYAMPGGDPARRQELETHFFSPVDHRAAEALEKLVRDGPDGLSPIQRMAWCVFMNSLRLRSPEDQKSIKAWVKANWTATTPELAEKYARERGPNAHATFQEYLAAIDDAEVERIALLAMPKMVTSRMVSEFVDHMHWSVGNLPDGVPDFLLSDRPIVNSEGLQRPDGYIAMPLGPRHVFLATTTPQGRDAAHRMVLKEFGRRMNSSVVGQAERYVWARDDRQQRFIDNHMSTTRQPTIGDRVRASEIAARNE